jgi:hypothetical protein
MYLLPLCLFGTDHVFAARALADDKIGPEHDLALPAAAADTVEEHPGRSSADVVSNIQAQLGAGPQGFDGDGEPVHPLPRTILILTVTVS